MKNVTPERIREIAKEITESGWIANAKELRKVARQLEYAEEIMGCANRYFADKQEYLSWCNMFAAYKEGRKW